MSAPSSAAKRPNVLLIQADQLAPQALKAYGNHVSITPNIDALASEAVVFDAAYCASPICTPSRMSMLTGRLPVDVQAWDNAAELSSATPTIAHHMRDQGYYTCLAGKMHFVGADGLHGFEDRLTTDVYPADFGWAPDWLTEERGVRNPMFFETLLSVAEADWVHTSMQKDFDDEVAFKTVRKIRELGRRATRRVHRTATGAPIGDSEAVDERPFFLLASFTEPHDPYSAPRRWWDAYEGVEIDEPAVPFIPREERDAHSKRVYDCMDGGDYDITAEHVRKARRAYYAMLSYVDEKIGELLAELEISGLRDDTLVVLTSDHGDMNGERGMWFKETFHERATRVPLMMSSTTQMRARYDTLASALAPRRVPRNVSHVDLLPTLLDVAVAHGQLPNWRAALPAPLPGISLLGDLRDLGDVDLAGEGTVYCEYTSEMIPGGWFMIKKGPLKFVYSPSAPPLLYDLAHDPLELSDVARDPTYTSAASELLELAEAQRPGVADGSLRRTILRSQAERKLVHRAMMAGKRTHWDFQPSEDASRTYARNTDTSLQDQEYESRAPYRGARPPPRHLRPPSDVHADKKPRTRH